MTSAPKFRFVRPGWVPSVITLAALAVTLGLGDWQLDRLQWKQDIIASIEARSSAPPVSAPDHLSSEYVDMEYRRVTAAGSYLDDLEIAIYALGPRGAPGYHLFTPLEMRDERGTVLVNRGWVPEDMKPVPAEPLAQSQPRRVDGVLRLPRRPSDFTPDNAPAEDKWFWPDMKVLAEARGLENVAGYIIEASPDPHATAPPYGGVTRFQIKNDHLEYAMTWFGLALVLVVIFVIYHIRRPEQD